MARYTPAKLCQLTAQSSIEATAYVALAGPVILKNVVLTNTSSSTQQVSVGVLHMGLNNLDPQDANFDTTSTTGSWGISGATIALSTAEAQSGANSLLITASAASPWTLVSGVYAVQPGYSFDYLVYARAATTAETFNIEAVTYDVNGIYNGTSTVASAADVSTGWTEIAGSLVTPGDTYAIAFQVTPTAIAAAGEQHYFDSFALYPSGTTGNRATRARSASWIAPKISVPPGITTLDLTVYMNRYDALTVQASASGSVNLYASGVLIS